MEVNASYKTNDNKSYLGAKCPYVNKISLCYYKVRCYGILKLCVNTNKKVIKFCTLTLNYIF